jgi:hypothetical protein
MNFNDILEKIGEKIGDIMVRTIYVIGCCVLVYFAFKLFSKFMNWVGD